MERVGPMSNPASDAARILADGFSRVREEVAGVLSGIDPHHLTWRPDPEADTIAWDPPVTLAVRLVSVIADDLQHVGQAAYVRGLAERSR